jgi:hypothetical protein
VNHCFTVVLGRDNTVFCFYKFNVVDLKTTRSTTISHFPHRNIMSLILLFSPYFWYSKQFEKPDYHTPCIIQCKQICDIQLVFQQLIYSLFQNYSDSYIEKGWICNKLWHCNQPSGTTTLFDSFQAWLTSEICSGDISVIKGSWTWKRRNISVIYHDV